MKAAFALLLAAVGVLGATGARWESAVYSPPKTETAPQTPVEKAPDLSTPEKRAQAVEKAKRGQLDVTLDALAVELARLRRALGQEEGE